MANLQDSSFHTVTQKGRTLAGMGNIAPPSDSLVFEVNGERFEIKEVDPSTTLLEFLRTRTRFKSVKLGCGEGVCLCVCVCVILENWNCLFSLNSAYLIHNQSVLIQSLMGTSCLFFSSTLFWFSATLF